MVEIDRCGDPFSLLLPALNIIGITLTQFRKRRSEIGVRKAFGACSFSLVEQVVIENLLTSCMGGLIGLLLSFGLLSLCKSLFFSGDVSLTHDMLIQPLTFVAAFFYVDIESAECCDSCLASFADAYYGSVA